VDCDGHTGEIVTTELIQEVFDANAVIIPDPVTTTPLAVSLACSAAEDTGTHLSPLIDNRYHS
jgi:hypothetical protein